jgi:hypothetical protein
VLIALLLAGPMAAAQVRVDPPTDLAEPSMRVSVEVERERSADQVRLTFTVRYLSTSTDGAPVVRLDVAFDSVAGGGSLDLESPPGWRATVFPPSGSAASRWQVSWSCSGEGWEHRLEHEIRPGQVVGGFRVSSRPGFEPGNASYVVDVDPGTGKLAPLGLSGRVAEKRLDHQPDW